MLAVAGIATARLAAAALTVGPLLTATAAALAVAPSMLVVLPLVPPVGLVCAERVLAVGDVGGTAGGQVLYTDALEVVFNKTVANRSKSDWKAYYSKGIGAVALEFREDKSPSGVFKFYLGD
jgi:hypothetical protein